MDTHKIRYLFEHRMLPGWFFREKEKLVGALLQDKTILFRMIDDLFQKEKVENPYTEEEFKAEATKPDDKTMVVKITFPQPENEPLCYYSYLIFDQKFEKTAYFCIEKGNAIGDDAPFICQWTADRTHINCGSCRLEENHGLDRCMEIYRQSFTN